MKFLLALIILLNISIAYAKKAPEKIPPKNKIVEINTKSERILGASIKEAFCEERIEKLKKRFTPLDTFVAGLLITASTVFLLIILLWIKSKSSGSKNTILLKFEKKLIPLKEEIIKKEKEIRTLKASIGNGSSAETDEKVASLEKALKEKEESIAGMSEEIENLKKGNVSDQLKKLQEELDLANSEKIEFLEMIESLQQQLTKKGAAESPSDSGDNVAELKLEIEDLKKELKLYTSTPKRTNTAPTEITDNEIAQLSSFLTTLNDTTEQKDKDVILTQDVLNKLLNESIAVAEVVEKFVVDKNVEQEPEKPENSEKPKEEKSDDSDDSAGGALSQNDLDSLMNGINSVAPASEPEKPKEEKSDDSGGGGGGGGALSQNDLDSLMNGINSVAPASEPEKPKEEKSDDSGGGGALSQNDLDALMNGINSVAPASEPEKPKEEKSDDSGGGALSQNDLDALMNGINSVAPASEPEKPKEEKSDDSAGSALSQNDLDSLMGSINSIPEAEEKNDEPAKETFSQDDLDKLF